MPRPQRVATSIGMAICVFLAPLAARAGGDDDAGAPRSRRFYFTYRARVTGLAPGQAARIWVPLPASNGDQAITILKQELPPEVTVAHAGQEPRFGNRMLYIEAKAGTDGSIPLALTFQVCRYEACGDPAPPPAEDEAAEARQAQAFLLPDARVPLGGKPAGLVVGRSRPLDPIRAARALYDVVNRHMEYRKDRPGWGNGDAEWACDSRFGNCTDFHSLFISLARTWQIPARFEIGFTLPEKRGSGAIPGYHCWAKFKPDGQGWIPVDVSEANKHPDKSDYFFGHLCENRIGFSVGRDITLVPPQAGAPLNFFIYPYVEVGGKPYPAERIEKAFGYQDLESTPTTTPE